MILDRIKYNTLSLQKQTTKTDFKVFNVIQIYQLFKWTNLTKPVHFYRRNRVVSGTLCKCYTFISSGHWIHNILGCRYPLKDFLIYHFQFLKTYNFVYSFIIPLFCDVRQLNFWETLCSRNKNLHVLHKNLAFEIQLTPTTIFYLNEIPNKGFLNNLYYDWCIKLKTFKKTRVSH